MSAIAWLLPGGVTKTTAKLIGSVTVTGTPVLQVSLAASMVAPASFVGDFIVGTRYGFTVNGLSPGTKYHYGFGGTKYGEFTTSPSNFGSFTLVVGGCHQEGNNDVLTHMLSDGPVGALFLGDNPYTDNTSNSTAPYLTEWNDMLSTTAMKALLSKCWLSYTWSDHDFGIDDTDGTASYRPFAETAYHQTFPNATMPGSAGQIYHTQVYGRVRVIMLDLMSQRSPESATDNASKTILGAEQKAWFKNVLLTATEPVIIVNVSEPWVENSVDNGWGLYTVERAELGTFFTANGLNSRLYFVAADMHALAWDNGSHTRYGTGSGNGPVLAHFAPMNHATSIKGGPYTIGPIITETTSYGKLEIIDNGGSSVQVRATGYSVQTSSVRTQEFQQTTTFLAQPFVTLNTALDLKLGTVQVSKALLGDIQVWPPPEPPSDLEITAGTTAAVASANGLWVARPGTWLKPVITALWWNSSANRWDGIIPQSTPGHKLTKDVMGTPVYGANIDSRSTVRPEIWWDDVAKKLWVAFGHQTSSQIHRFTYTVGSDTYALDSGFPKTFDRHGNLPVGRRRLRTTTGRSPSTAPRTGTCGRRSPAATSTARTRVACSVSRSIDDGVTWSTPVNLDNTVTAGATGMGHVVDAGVTKLVVVVQPERRRHRDSDVGTDQVVVDRPVGRVDRIRLVGPRHCRAPPGSRRPTITCASAAYGGKVYAAFKTTGPATGDPLMGILVREPGGGGRGT